MVASMHMQQAGGPYTPLRALQNSRVCCLLQQHAVDCVLVSASRAAAAAAAHLPQHLHDCPLSPLRAMQQLLLMCRQPQQVMQHSNSTVQHRTAAAAAVPPAAPVLTPPEEVIDALWPWPCTAAEPTLDATAAAGPVAASMRLIILFTVLSMVWWCCCWASSCVWLVQGEQVGHKLLCCCPEC
jgi:hypothetical protein